jgi:hypothetical protein
VCVYVLAAIVKKQLAIDVSLYTFLQILPVHSLENIPILPAFCDHNSGHRVARRPGTSNDKRGAGP